MAKLINPNADPAHQETDKEIAGLEKKIKSVYRQAEKNATEKFNTYMAKFKVKDEAHKSDVASGKWTQEQYDNWRRNQLLYADNLSTIRDTIAKDLHNADKIATQMVRDKQVDVYALNHNYGTYEIEHGLGIDTSYSLYDHDTVERLIKDNPQLLPKPSAKKQREIDAKDIAWNKEKLSSAFTASILSGDSIPKMAQKISEVAEMDHHAAIRNARTMCTGAENAGRINSYERAKGMGIKMKQEWMATLDSRTRDSHRMVDGEIIEVGKKFSNGCRFPGDPEAPAREVYNCRCTLIAVVNGIDAGAFDKTDTLRRKLENATITYEEWKNGHKKEAPTVTEIPETKPVQGKNLIGKIDYDSPELSQFDFDIEKVMHVQGFDGKPQVVGQEEFNNAVKESGFYAERAYSGETQEIVDSYQEQLYNGKWYVDCSTGGAQYGQGMYCAASYIEEDTSKEAFLEDILHYGDYYDGIGEEMEHYTRLGKSRGFNFSKIEDITLTPDAKILEIPLEESGRGGQGTKDFVIKKYVEECLSDGTHSKALELYKKWKEQQKTLQEYDNTISNQRSKTKKRQLVNLRNRLAVSNNELYEELKNMPEWKMINSLTEKDAGVLAAEMGYDAINAGGHGLSGSYTVILNRTKCIILDGKQKDGWR